jgi:carboxypeptidase Q
MLAEMKGDGLDGVRAEPVMVPHWVRGSESAELVLPYVRRLPMLGLGGSIATPPGGITADVLVVSSFDELKARAAEAKGKIVLFDVAFETYGQTVAYRTNGAVEAARAGAVASLIRSVTPYSLQTPHTGAMQYDSAVARIPHAAITVEDATLLHRLQLRGERVRVKLQMQASTQPDAPSRNVMAELRGRERPDEVVVLGGHSDSWDVGQGAMDDGGGVVAAWEAVRLLKVLGLQPRRTIRVVAWVNEENGLRGGRAYLEAHRSELARHVAAIETDAGVFKPTGFGFGGSGPGHRAPDRGAAAADRRGYDPGRRRRGRHRPDHGSRSTGAGIEREWGEVLLVPPLRCRHHRQAGPPRAGRMRGDAGSHGIRPRRPARAAAPECTVSRAP